MRRRLIWRFLITYICVMIPVLSVNLLVARQTMAQLKSKASDTASANLHRVVKELDSEYSTLYEISVRLSSITKLLPYKMLGDYGKAREGIDLLESVNFYNTSIQDVFLHYGTEYVFSSAGMTGANTYFQTVLGCDAQNTEKAWRLIESAAEGCVCLRSGTTGGFLLLHYPIRTGPARDRSVSANYLIPFSRLTALLGRLTDGGSNPVYVNLSFEYGETLRLSVDDDQNLRILARDVELKALDKHTILRETIDRMRIDVDVYYRSDLLYDEVLRAQRFNALLTVGGMLFSALAAILFSRVRERNIRKLESVALGAAVEEGRGKGEYAYLSGLLRGLVAENAATAQKFRNMLRARTAAMLFGGAVKQGERIHEMLEECEVSLQDQCFCVIGVCMDENEQLRSRFKATLSQTLYCEAEVAGHTAILYLAELAAPDKYRKLRGALAEQARGMLDRWGAREILIGVSRAYDHLSLVNLAYMEAIGALNQIWSDGRVLRVLFWESNFGKPGRTMQLEQNVLGEFSHAVEQNDYEGAARLLRELCRCIESRSCGPENKVYLRYCILQLLITTIDAGETELIAEIMSIDPTDAEAFEAAVERVLLRYCSPGSQQGAPEIGAQIIAYIEENYARNDLSAELVAAQVGYTRSHFGKLFKAQTGVSYLEYVNKVRMNKACELLRTTDLPVHEIVMRVGYVDDSSFRRKFKALYQVGVAEYRAHARGRAEALPDDGAEEMTV